MIAHLRGRIFEKHPNRIVVDVDGVGYDVSVPLSTFYGLGEAGAPIALRIHTHVREETLALYGFATRLEHRKASPNTRNGKILGNTKAGKNIKPKNLTTTNMTDALTGTPTRASIIAMFAMTTAAITTRPRFARTSKTFTAPAKRFPAIAWSCAKITPS